MMNLDHCNCIDVNTTCRKASGFIDEILRIMETISSKTSLDPEKSSKVCMLTIDTYSSIIGDLISEHANECFTTPLPHIHNAIIPEYVREDTTVVLIFLSEDSTEINNIHNDLVNLGCTIICISNCQDLLNKCVLAGHTTIAINSHDLHDCMLRAIGAVATVLQNLGVHNYTEDFQKVLVDFKNYEHDHDFAHLTSLANLDWNLLSEVNAIYCPSNMIFLANWLKIIIKKYFNKLTFIGELPEFNHNELVGWSSSNILLRETFPLILYDHSGDKLINLLTDCMIEILEGTGRNVLAVSIYGKNSLEKTILNLFMINHLNSDIWGGK